MEKISPRLAAIVDQLPLTSHSRVIEIGCGTGVAARAIAAKLSTGQILAIDRSEKAVKQTVSLSADAIASGKMTVRRAAVENFRLEANEQPYDFAFAVRVGALDGRHPEIEEAALRCIAKALVKGGRLFIDGGDPLKEISLG